MAQMQGAPTATSAEHAPALLFSDEVLPGTTGTIIGVGPGTLMVIQGIDATNPGAGGPSTLIQASLISTGIVFWQDQFGGSPDCLTYRGAVVVEGPANAQISVTGGQPIHVTVWGYKTPEPDI